MQSYKIEHFNIEGEKSFPDFKTLDSKECSDVVQNWREHFSCDPDITDVELMNIISLASQPVSGFSGEDEDFKLSLLLEKLKISPPEVVYLNWYRFDKVDKMLFKELCENFDAIWYPSSDDLDLFDFSFDWIIYCSLW